MANKKPVKKATVKKPSAKPASSIGRKAATKPAAKPASSIGRKVTAPKKAVKKAAVKKPVVKAAPVKAKKATPVKKIPIAIGTKSASPAGRKAAILKAKTKPVSIVKKAAPKAAARIVNKKPIQKPKPVTAKDSLPPVTQLSEELVEKAAHTNSNSMMVPGNGLNEVLVKTEDPVKSFDKNVFNKATSKGDPHSKLHLSTKPKNAIKPSGKKPLW